MNDKLDSLLKKELSSVKQIFDQRGVKKGKKKKNGIDDKDSTKEITLNIIDRHYFIEERTNITKAYVFHKYPYSEDIPTKNQNMIYRKDAGWVVDNRDKSFMKSEDLVRLMLCILLRTHMMKNRSNI